MFIKFLTTSNGVVRTKFTKLAIHSWVSFYHSDWLAIYTEHQNMSESPGFLVEKWTGSNIVVILLLSLNCLPHCLLNQFVNTLLFFLQLPCQLSCRNLLYISWYSKGIHVCLPRIIVLGLRPVVMHWIPISHNHEWYTFIPVSIV